MTELLLRMLLWVTVGLVVVLLVRRPARRVFGAGPAFSLWLLPVVLALAPWLPQGVAPAAMVELPILTVTPQAHTAAHALTSFAWGYGLIVLWLVGATLGLLRLTLHCLRLRRGMRAAPVAWSRWLAESAPGLDLRRVRRHDAGPAVLAALPRALVLLPEDFTQRFDTAATRELVLWHELTHARRGDAWWTLAMEIVSALLWFHPLLWIARPRFRLDQELACDAASLRALPSRSAGYARALLDSVAAQPVTALIPWLAEPQLKERIAMLAKIPPGALRRRAGFVAVAALLSGGLLVAGGQTAVAVQAGASGSSEALPPAVAVQVTAGGSTSSAPPAVDATFKSRNPPHYPVDAIKHGEQGKVLLDVTIDKHGNVIGIVVDARTTTAPASLQSAALAAAANWKFKPGMQGGKPVGGVVQVPVTFSLNPDWSAGGNCPPGFLRKQGKGESYSCVRPKHHQSAPAASA